MRLFPAFLAIAALSFAQQMDDEFAKSVKEWTTAPEFISPLVDHLPKSSTVPSPKDVLGYYAGAPKKLTYYADLLKYYHALEAKSPRVKVMNVGQTRSGISKATGNIWRSSPIPARSRRRRRARSSRKPNRFIT
jgi:hypothetical protein